MQQNSDVVWDRKQMIFTLHRPQDLVLRNQNKTPLCCITTDLLCWCCIFSLEELWKRVWTIHSGFLIIPNHLFTVYLELSSWLNKPDSSTVCRPKLRPVFISNSGTTNKIYETEAQTGVYKDPKYRVAVVFSSNWLKCLASNITHVQFVVQIYVQGLIVPVFFSIFAHLSALAEVWTQTVTRAPFPISLCSPWLPSVQLTVGYSVTRLGWAQRLDL